jgi:hypothetical protein
MWCWCSRVGDLCLCGAGALDYAVVRVYEGYAVFRFYEGYGLVFVVCRGGKRGRKMRIGCGVDLC